jgi:hypothetical protein
MNRRWPALAVVVAVAATPLLTACNDDEPSQPTITLDQSTIDPDVSVGTIAGG